MTELTLPSSQPLFPLGAVTLSKGVKALAEDSLIQEALARHAAGDWRDLDSEYQEVNRRKLALGSGDVFSVHHFPEHSLWVWMYTSIKSPATTVILPDEAG